MLSTDSNSILFAFHVEMTQDNKNPTIVHFEIPADDVERARKFYSTLFGWKIEKAEVKVDADTMDYWMISTSGIVMKNLL